MYTHKARKLRVFIETVREELQAVKDARTDEGCTYGIQFSFGTARGGMTNSEALSLLATLERIIKAVDEDLICNLDFDLQMLPEAIVTLNKAVDDRMKKVMALEEPSKLAVPKAQAS